MLTAAQPYLGDAFSAFFAAAGVIALLSALGFLLMKEVPLRAACGERGAAAAWWSSGAAGSARSGSPQAPLDMVYSLRQGPTETRKWPSFHRSAEAVAANIKDGDTVAFEGFTHLIPFAAVHETIRQKRRDLHLVRMTPDLIYDQLIGMGCVRKLTFSWGGNPGVGSLHRFRDAVENAWPHPLEMDEHSHAALANAYEAGAAGLPCAILRGYRGTQHGAVNPNIKSVTCPFTGEVLAAVPSCPRRLCGDPCPEGGPQGQCLPGRHRRGSERGRARRQARHRHGRRDRVTISAMRAPTPAILPSWTVSAVVAVPGGAHPSYAHGYYKRDNAYYKAWGRHRP